MRDSLNSQVINVPLDLEQHKEKSVWRCGTKCSEPVVNPEAVGYFDTAEAATVARNDGLLRGDIVLLPEVSEITVHDASQFARDEGIPKVYVYDSNYDIVEWWWA